MNRALITDLLPPFVLRRARRLFPNLVYEKKGFIENKNGWAFVPSKADKFLQDQSPLANNLKMTFAYVLAKSVSWDRIKVLDYGRVSVLDYGGGFGQYYFLAKTLFPELVIDYHIKEIPRVVTEARKTAPHIKWHHTEKCFDRSYDLVFLSGSLQCINDWKGTLQKCCGSATKYLFITRVPVVRKVEGFVANHRHDGVRTSHRIFNDTELIEHIRSFKMKLEMTFLLDEWPVIRNAKEDCRLKGFLFSKAG